MDGRGRELQQVESRNRFWWRAAADAPTPGPAAAFYNATPEPFDEAPALPVRTVTAARTRRATFRLQIPRGERRFRKRRSRRIGWARPALAAIGATALIAGIAMLPFQRLRAIDVSGRASDLLVAAGFGIDQVNLSGQHFAGDGDIFDALDLRNVRTFASFDSDAALKRIERVPWVASAQLTRVYPGTLDIAVRERTPAFVWVRGDTSYLVDATGRTLGPMASGSQWKLPRVLGEGADEDAIDMLSAVRQVPKIEAVFAYGERIAGRRWRIVLRNGTVLELATDREIEGLQTIADSEPLQGALNGVSAMIIDVRTPGRIAVRPATPDLARTASLTSAETASLVSRER
jgi:cell division protein FtsQ